MKKVLCVILFVVAAVANERATAQTVTEYPSFTSFDSNWGPWVSSAGNTYWSRVSSRYWYNNNAYTYFYAKQGFGNFATLYTSNGSALNATLSAYFDLSSVTDPTISFDYHMRGDNYSSMALYASTDGGVNYSDLWVIGGNLGTNWYSTNISLSAYAGETNLLLFFSGHPGSAADWLFDISLDSIAVEGITGNDIDGDGMPNEWETQYFGGPTNGVPTGNGDLDQYNNLEEYIAGLNPTVSDGLWLTGFTVNGNNVFNWTPQSGRVYSVYWADNLMNGFSLMGGNLTSGSFTDTVHGAASGGYYKLQVDVAP